MYERKHNLTFEGVFSNLCLEFIKYKRGLGHKYSIGSQYIVHDICSCLNRMNINDIILTRDTIETLAKRRSGESLETQAIRIRFLQQFAVFLTIKGYDAYVYPKHNMPRYKYDFRPYIFSHDQIIAIFKASDKIIPCKHSPKAHLVYPALIRTLYACGLRSMEARKLKICNVNLDDGILYIEKSKNNTSRYVPMSKSLRDYCREYAFTMKFSKNDSGYFFPAPDKGYYHPFTLAGRCHKIFKEAGIPRLSNGRFPRVHDIRHSHIGHALTKLIKKEKMDVYTAVPLIAAYVGHTYLRDTERYLHLPEFNFPDIIKIGQTVIANAVREVKYEE